VHLVEWMAAQGCAMICYHLGVGNTMETGTGLHLRVDLYQGE